MRSDLPTGTVTFLFTDVEGSTKLLHELGAEEYSRVLVEHRRVLRAAFGANQGVEVDTQGDAFFVAFPTAPGALGAAAEALEGLASGPIRVRMGIHTGTSHLGEEGYVGVDVHRAARIAASGHGGQVLVSASTAGLVGTNGLRDLGEHRLKDLSAPERIFQLGTGDFPPLNTLHETNLPVPATPFLGRDREIDQIAELLRRSDVRLVTLTGPGGSGKTRLSLQAAAAAADDYDRGVWWVPLASLDDPTLVETVIAQTLGSKDTLSAAVGDKRLLLVLDNFEHLLDAAAGVAEAIGSCPHLTVLVTSREPLHIEGEWEVAVDPLREREAVELFTQRAAAVRSDFVASGEVAEICRRLDCLPLAIELAAARVKALSLSVLLERLEQRLPLLAGGSRSAPERQRTLRATIAWSYDLLTAAEQDLFARLAVFAGGCRLEAAEEICGADLDVVASLVDKSLLRRTGERYWMLETIREYAAERLSERDDADAFCRRHAEHFLALAERAAPELEREGQTVWLERLDSDHDNFRVATDWASGSRDQRLELRLVCSLYWFWYMRGHWHEGRQALERALAADNGEDLDLRTRAFNGVAWFAQRVGDRDAWKRNAEACLRLGRDLGDTQTSGRALRSLATLALTGGDHAGAKTLFAESAQLSTSVGDTWNLAIIANNRGEQARAAGDFAGAVDLLEEAVSLSRRLGDRRGIATMLTNLAGAELSLGQHARAAAHIKEALVTSRELMDREAMANALGRLATLCAANENPIQAATLLAAETRAREFAGEADWTEPAEDELDEYTIVSIAQLDESTREAALEAGRKMSLEEAIDYALQTLA